MTYRLELWEVPHGGGAGRWEVWRCGLSPAEGRDALAQCRSQRIAARLVRE
jgi:hypothetical protein